MKRSRLPASANLHYRLEHLGWQNNAGRFEALVKLGPDARSPETPGYFAGFRDPGFLEQENVLQRDHVLLHPDHFGDVRDPARTVAESRHLHEEVYGGRD